MTRVEGPGTVTRQRISWRVSMPVTNRDLYDMMAMAEHTARERGVNTGCDNWLTIEPDDEGIVAWFEVETPISTPDTSKVTRVEVIGQARRIMQAHGLMPGDVRASLQDDGRTIKIMWSHAPENLSWDHRKWPTSGPSGWVRRQPESYVPTPNYIEGEGTAERSGPLKPGQTTVGGEPESEPKINRTYVGPDGTSYVPHEYSEEAARPPVCGLCGMASGHRVHFVP